MIKHTFAVFCAGLLLTACAPEKSSSIALGQTGVVENPALDEISGVRAGIRNPDALFVHNDDGPARVSVIDWQGRDLGSFVIEGGANRDWEDIAAAPSSSGPLLIVADIGDNFAQWDEIILYFVLEPTPGPDGKYGGTVELFHSVSLRYPEGARDCESLAYDPASGKLLFMTKRDRPPRLYGIGLEQALTTQQSELEFIGEAHLFRQPTTEDMAVFGARDGPWVSQPTGMDISPDGTRAAIISYRSLYVFSRAPDEDWAEAFGRKPIEFEGPPSMKEEAVSFTDEGQHIVVTTEGIPAPVYRFDTPVPIP